MNRPSRLLGAISQWMRCVGSGGSSDQRNLRALPRHAGGQWEKARDLFDLMQQQGCTPDVVTYTALISAFERGGKWQLALQVRFA